MEGAAFAALTLGAILANSIGHESEIRQAARPRQGDTWHLGFELAARDGSEVAEGVGLNGTRFTERDVSPPLLLAHS